ncbi:hypothetical protein ES703_77780 [subsurface metagenome]
MIRGILYWVGGIIFTIPCALYFYLMYPFFRRSPDLPHLIIRFWSRILVKIFYGAGIEVIGKENIEPAKNYIIVSNHRSYTDILFANAAIPLQFRWLSKSSLFKIPVFGLAMKIAGYVPIERTKYMSASRSLEKIKEVLNKEKSVWIFPEGTRTPQDEPGRFKRGAFLLAKETEKPLLPVVMVNTDKIFLKPFIIRPVCVQVIVLKPVYYSDFNKSQMSERVVMDQMSQHIRKIIRSNYNAYAARF